jgi:hypothetical protein
MFVSGIELVSGSTIFRLKFGGRFFVFYFISETLSRKSPSKSIII